MGNMTNYLQELAEEVEEELLPIYRRVHEISLKNHARVLSAFRQNRVSEFHLRGSTGYGYGDAGREVLERIYAQVFGAESALVRGQIVSGTHAIALCLYGVLRPGDELLSVQGTLYDTFAEIIGIKGNYPGSLKDFGVKYRQIELTPGGEPDWDEIRRVLKNHRVRMVVLQRSRGYAMRPSLCLEDMAVLISFIRSINPEVVVLVDNCYGEFVETREPPAVGADLVAGSLIKNPGGGLAPTGGYVVGSKKYVEMAAGRLTAPGIGADVGPTQCWQRLFYQGFFLAPHAVAEALKGAIFAARLFERLGFEVSPRFDEPRTDLIQSIVLGSPEPLLAFCRGIQHNSPVDSFVVPEPSHLPGYEDPIVMAAGTFIQGASLEFTADAPLREPYAVYFQGGLSYEYTKLGLLAAAEEVLRCVGNESQAT